MRKLQRQQDHMDFMGPAISALLTNLLKLPAQLREIIERVYGENLSLSEAAAALGISEATALERRQRALKLLHDELEREAIKRESRRKSSGGKSWRHKYDEMRNECRRLRRRLAKTQAERDVCLLLTRQAIPPHPFSFPEEEMRAMLEHPITTADLLRDLKELEARHHDRRSEQAVPTRLVGGKPRPRSESR
jgi:hypothetical protein